MAYSHESLADIALVDAELAEDIHANLRSKESQLPRFAGLSPFLTQRRIIVDWIYLMGQNFHLSQVIVHTAIFYYDQFTDKVNVPHNNLRLSALACLVLAAKFEGREEDVPRFADLLVQCGNEYTAADLEFMEIVLLQFFQWNMCSVVAPSYLEYYIQRSTMPLDRVGGRPIRLDDLQRGIREHCVFFIETSSQEVSMQRFRPSVLAASAVTASRLCLNVEPAWSPELERVSLLSQADIMECTSEMCRMYDQAQSSRVQSPTMAHDAFAMSQAQAQDYAAWMRNSSHGFAAMQAVQVGAGYQSMV
eukprot:m.153492 g.153492  ORF g.153492 m.153492 type:complete len:305 (-) comp16940_c0_seq5:303-1217(-)